MVTTKIVTILEAHTRGRKRTRAVVSRIVFSAAKGAFRNHEQCLTPEALLSANLACPSCSRRGAVWQYCERFAKTRHTPATSPGCQHRCSSAQLQQRPKPQPLWALLAACREGLLHHSGEPRVRLRRLSDPCSLRGEKRNERESKGKSLASGLAGLRRANLRH
jgi:hypothetical protein